MNKSESLLLTDRLNRLYSKLLTKHTIKTTIKQAVFSLFFSLFGDIILIDEILKQGFWIDHILTIDIVNKLWILLCSSIFLLLKSFFYSLCFKIVLQSPDECFYSNKMHETRRRKLESACLYNNLQAQLLIKYFLW